MNKRLQYSLTHNACIKPSIYLILMKSSHTLATTSSKMLCQQAIRHAKCYINITKAKTHCTHALVTRHAEIYQNLGITHKI